MMKKEKPTWTSLPAAAELLGLHVLTLRRAVERNARKAPDGCVESNFDGIRARKFGRCWRVAIGSGWTEAPGKPGGSQQ